MNTAVPLISNRLDVAIGGGHQPLKGPYLGEQCLRGAGVPHAGGRDTRSTLLSRVPWKTTPDPAGPFLLAQPPGREPADPPGANPPPPPPAEPQPPDDDQDMNNARAETAPPINLPSRMIVPPFDPGRMRRQIAIDSLLHWLAVLVVMAGLFVLLTVMDDGGSMLNVIPVVLVLLAWMMVNLISARVSRELPRLSATIADDPPTAERRLAEHLRRRPLLRWVRLMLYHRLAMLRHRQRRFAESAAICQAVLGYSMGPAREARAHLLLLLSEASLEEHDLGSAYGALSELHRMRLSLIEALQRLALQTRYELQAGYDDAVLHRREQKVQLAELMPAPQCSAVHAMLATAADRTHAASLAGWLWARVELLAAPEQLARLRSGEFGVELVDAMPPATPTDGMDETFTSDER
ncbi:MAG: hypothetical protein WD534_13940 [Phycisphaeraceae bacterium]